MGFLLLWRFCCVLVILVVTPIDVDGPGPLADGGGFAVKVSPIGRPGCVEAECVDGLEFIGAS